MSALACQTRQTRLGPKFSLLFLLSFINLIVIQIECSQHILLDSEEHDIQIATDAKNATNPLIYKRLRFDEDSLRVYRRFQKDLTIDETKVTLEINQTQADNQIKLEKYTYYASNKVEATSLTQDDIIFEALDQSYFTRLFPSYLYTYDNKRDRAESSDPRLVSQWKCERELNFLMDQLEIIQRARVNGANTGIKLNNTFSIDVLALFDAFGTEEPGLILGNYLWSGYWRQCKRSLIFNRDTINPENTLEFKSRYCIASIRSKRWDQIAASRIPELEKRHFKYPEQKYDYARFHRIQIGLCLPESCDSSLIDQRREDVRRLATHKLSEPLKSYALTDLYCLPDETSKLRQVDFSGRLFLVFITVWLAIVISATVYDYRVGLHEKQNNSTKSSNFLERIANSISVIRNYERLIETTSFQSPAPKQSQATDSDGKHAGKVRPITERNTPTINDLLFMNCIKVLTTPMIIISHIGMFSKQLDRFTLDYDSINTNLSHFFFSAVLLVDWYFVLTGFITSYAMFVTKRVERNNLAAWLYTIVHRYLRLAPIYLLLFWFVKSVSKHTSSGPIWDYGTNNMTLRAMCQRESFIYPLTLTSNFYPIHKECIMPSWYVSSDFQYYLITPFLLILLHRAPLKGWLVSLGAIGACVALRFHRFLTDPRAKHLDLMRSQHDTYMRYSWDMDATYTYPQYRIASYLIGILAGHYTYMVLSGQWHSPLFYDRAASKAKSSKEDAWMKKRKDLLRLSVWTFSATILSSMMFVTSIIYDFPSNLESHVKLIASLTYSISHSNVGLAMSMFLITMMFGQFGPLKRVMSWPIWTIISRVCFIVYLAQIEVFYWFAQSGDRVNELSTLELIKCFLYTCATLYPLSTLATLLFEMPIAQLERNILRPIFQSSSRGAH